MYHPSSITFLEYSSHNTTSAYAKFAECTLYLFANLLWWLLPFHFRNQISCPKETDTGNNFYISSATSREVHTPIYHVSQRACKMYMWFIDISFGIICVFIGHRVLINSLVYARCFNYVEFHQSILNLASLFILCHAWILFRFWKFHFQVFLLPQSINYNICRKKLEHCLCTKYADTKLCRKTKTSLTWSRILRVA